jgi:hypothetical protein
MIYQRMLRRNMKSLEEAYLQGWQDAADAVTSNFENALRTAIESVEVPNFGDEDDNTEKSQG